MRLGLVLALFLVALVQSFSEGRTVSRCELKDKLGKLLVLPRELQRFKQKILTRVICRLERETRLNTELLQVLERGPTSSSAIDPTGNPAGVRRKKRMVEFFPEEMRKLQEEVDAMKPVPEEVHKQEEDDDSTNLFVEALKDQSSTETKVDQDEMNPEDNTHLTFEELERILTRFKNKDVKNAGEDALRLEEDLRDTEEEVEKRVIDQLDRDEVDTAGATHNMKDTPLIFEELEKLLMRNSDRDNTDVVEKRVINKLDRDEVDASEDKNIEDSNVTEDEKRKLINNMDRDETNTEEDTQEEKEKRVINKLDRDEVDASEDKNIEDSNVTEDEKRKLINNMDRDETNTEEDTQEETEKRVINKLDRDEVDASEDKNIEDSNVTEDEKRKLTNNMDRDETNTEEDTQEEKEKRVINKLDRDEVDASEDKNIEDSNVTEDEKRKLINNMDRDETNTEEDTQEEKEKRVINKLDRDEVDTSKDKEDTQEDSNLTSEDEETLINSMDRDEKMEDTQQNMDQDETNIEVNTSEDKAEETSLTAEDKERTSTDGTNTVEDTPGDGKETSSMKGEDTLEEAEGTKMNKIDGDKMNSVQGDIRKTEEDEWRDEDDMDTSSMKGVRTNRTFEELVSILIEKINKEETNTADDGPKLNDIGEGVVKDERNPGVDMSNVKMVLEEVERKVISQLDKDETNPREETPEGEKEVRDREEEEPRELIRYLNRDEKNPGHDTAVEEVDRDKTNEDVSEDTSSVQEVEVKTINQPDQDERNTVEDVDRNVALEDVARRLIKELEQEERNPVGDTNNTEDVTKKWILEKLRRIINKLDDGHRDAPKDKRDTSVEVERNTVSGLQDKTQVDTASEVAEIQTNEDNTDSPVDVDMEVAELEKMFIIDENDTLVDKDLEEYSSVLDELLSDMNDASGPAVKDKARGGRRKRSLSRRRRPLWLFGLVQLSDHRACDSGSGRSRNVCNTNCTAFIDDDITDDLQCFVKIKAWTFLLRSACPADQDFFQDCP